MMTIDEMQDVLDDIAEEIPREFYHQLNGGILLLPEAKPSPHARHNDLWIMGEYVTDGSMGRYIRIYYGSFKEVYQHASRDKLVVQLKDTLLHEFTHHLEGLAGERGLEIWDEEQLRKYFGMGS